MPVQLILPQNKLVYPSRNPGFDPTHPAARGMSVGNGVSGIAAPNSQNSSTSGGTFTGLLKGNPYGFGGTTQKTGLIGINGPSVSFAQNAFLTSEAVTSANTEGTIAAILFFNGTPAAFQTIYIASAASVTQYHLGTNNTTLQLRSGGTLNNVLSTFTLSANHPYFVATSSKNSLSTTNFVATDLKTGQIYSSTTTGTNLGIGTATTCNVAGASFVALSFTGGNMSAVMHSRTYTSLQALLQWAADPWAFWYPGTAPIVINSSPKGGAAFPRASYQNKLTFPNRNPGFDPSHPAAKNILVSAAAASPGFISLLSGKASTLSGSSAVKIDPAIGLTWNANNSSFYSITKAATPAQATWACIIVGVTNTTNSFLDDGNNGIFTSSNVFKVGSSGSNRGSITMTLGTPYFCAASQMLNNANLVVANLATGQIQVENQASGFATTNASTTARAGTVNGVGFFQGRMIAVMINGTFMSKADLFNWAQDPWAFWYPRTAPIVFKSPSGTTTAVSVTEAASATDSVTVLHTIKTTLTEAASATDSPTVLATHKVTLSEAASATDTESAKAISQGVISESGNATDADTVQATHTTTLIESGAATDTVSATGTSASKKVVGWFAEWDKKRPIPLELLRGILNEQGSPWAEEITELYKDAQEKEPESKKHAAALKKVIRKLPEYVLEPIDWGPIVLSLQAALTTSRSAQAIKNANAALMELRRQHREIEEDEEESIMLLLH